MDKITARELMETTAVLVNLQARTGANIIGAYFDTVVYPLLNNPVLGAFNPFVAALQAWSAALGKTPVQIDIDLPFHHLPAANDSVAATLGKMPKTLRLSWPTPKITPETRAAARHEHAQTARNPDQVELHLSANPADNIRALAMVTELLTTQHRHRSFGITHATILGEKIPVRETVLRETPFTRFVQFDTDDAPRETIFFGDPISGHPSSLIRNPVQYALNGGMRVVVPVRKDIMDVPATHGKYGLEEHVDEYRQILRQLGPNIHVIPICQPIGAIMSALALMAEQEGFEVDSLHSFGAPFDNHAADNDITVALRSFPSDWSSRHMRTVVPAGKAGAGREIFWGDDQIGNFIMMNPAMHIKNLICGLFNACVEGDEETIKDIHDFAIPFLSGQSVPWNLAHDTEHWLFRGNLLARGKLRLFDHTVNTAAIKRTVIHTLHGVANDKGVGGDDVTPEGAHIALHPACPSVMQAGNAYHTRIPGKGHYGPWEGSAARDISFPRIFSLIHQIARQKGRDPGPLLDTQGNPMASLALPQKFDPSLLRTLGARISVPGPYFSAKPVLQEAPRPFAPAA